MHLSPKQQTKENNPSRDHYAGKAEADGPSLAVLQGAGLGARLDEAQAEIKIGGRNINNLRYAEDTTLMAESEEELKSLLMKVK